MKKFLEEMSVRYVEAEQRIANRCVAFATHLIGYQELLELQATSYARYQEDKAFIKSYLRYKKRSFRHTR